MSKLVTSALSQARKKAGLGAVKGFTGGRADKVPASTPQGSYVIPADVVSALGQGNSEAGHQKLFGAFPGSKPLKPGKARPPKLMNMGKFASGGDVPIVVSDGEFIVSPEDVARIGGGDLTYGHDVLDEFVKHTRQDNIQQLAALPGPKGT